jgi:hypothetical protein
VNDSTSGRPPRRRLIIGIIGALLLVAIVLAVGIGIGRDGSGGASAPSASASPSSAPRAVPVGQTSVCGLPGLDSAGATLITAPATTWTTVGTMLAPSGTQIGPGTTGNDGLRSCYAHTVTGALFAIANIWAMGTDPRLNKALLERQTAAGTGRDVALKADIPTSNTGLRAQIAGFKVTSYTGMTATVDLAFHLNTGELVSLPAPLAWDGRDWKVELADDGSAVFGASSLNSLAGYIPWAGEQ